MEQEHTEPDRPGDAMSRLQDELRMVEEGIDQTRRAAAESRSRLGEHAEGAIDVEDRSAAIAQADEQEELLGFLIARRENLQERIRGLAGTGR